MKTTPIIRNEVFDDLHKLESNLYQWEMVFKKISIGKFHGSLCAIDMGVIQLIDARMSGTLFQSGYSPEGYNTIAIPAIDTQSFWWHYRKVNNTSLLLFPDNRLLNAVSYDGFHVYIISIEKEFLKELIHKYDLDPVRENFTGDAKVITMGKQHLYPMNSMLQALFLKVRASEDSPFKINFQNNVQFKIPEMLLNILHQHESERDVHIRRNRDQSISKAVDFILGQDLSTLTVQNISSSTDIKMRTLEYAFKEYFNVGPKIFINALRHNDFRHDLRQSRRSVSETAAKHGFSHLGQLSRDYKLLFGELPSETLKWAKMERLQADPQN